MQRKESLAERKRLWKALLDLYDWCDRLGASKEARQLLKIDGRVLRGSLKRAESALHPKGR